jgi:hypothetical protein
MHRIDDKLERNNLNKSQWNAFRTPQNIDQTISSRKSTNRDSTRVARIRIPWTRHNQYTYERWHNVVNFLLAKEPGIPRCHKLQVIHLYEADLNALIGIKWRQLIYHVTDNRLLSPWQCGEFPGREAHTPVLLEELTWEITRTSCRPLLRMDFDASSCYDRIIPSLSSLVSRSYGQHRNTCLIYGRFLRNAKFKLKTKLGVSDKLEEYSQSLEIVGGA